jgi:hypothetical protein
VVVTAGVGEAEIRQDEGCNQVEKRERSAEGQGEESVEIVAWDFNMEVDVNGKLGFRDRTLAKVKDKDFN